MPIARMAGGYKGRGAHAWAPLWRAKLDLPAPPPVREDRADAVVVLPRRSLRGEIASGDPGKHLRDQELVEHLADRGVREPGVADVLRVLLRDRVEDAVLPARRVGVACQPRRHVGDRASERREVVEARVLERPDVL